MKVYLDNCCLNRPFDDRSNIKNYLEREAVLLVLELAYENGISIIGSDILIKEISRVKDLKKRIHVQSLYDNCVTEHIVATPENVKYAKYLADTIGTKPFDSLHLSVAEQNADYFLTTDVRLIRASARADLLVKVMNPIQFIMEVMSGE